MSIDKDKAGNEPVPEFLSNIGLDDLDNQDDDEEPVTGLMQLTASNRDLTLSNRELMKQSMEMHNSLQQYIALSMETIKRLNSDITANNKDRSASRRGTKSKSVEQDSDDDIIVTGLGNEEFISNRPSPTAVQVSTAENMVDNIHVTTRDDADTTVDANFTPLSSRLSRQRSMIQPSSILRRPQSTMTPATSRPSVTAMKQRKADRYSTLNLEPKPSLHIDPDVYQRTNVSKSPS